jgi:hypothetical protein
MHPAEWTVIVLLASHYLFGAVGAVRGEGQGSCWCCSVFDLLGERGAVDRGGFVWVQGGGLPLEGDWKERLVFEGPVL